MNTDFASVSFQLILIFRLVVAALCGMGIGFERKNRLKEAGLRTHLIVAVGAALMMIVSKYGFFDLVGAGDLFKVDASRIASQIVTGIGFLGAGTIFIRNRSVTGLTTAAGIWTTAGIGMAVGAGMYWLGLACTALVLISQYALHSASLLNFPGVCSLVVRIDESKGGVNETLRCLQETGAELIDMDISRKKVGMVKLDLRLKLEPGMEAVSVVEHLEKQPFILEVES